MSRNGVKLAARWGRRRFLSRCAAGALLGIAPLIGKRVAAKDVAREIVLGSNEIVPMLTMDNGQLGGFLFDIIADAAKRADLKVTFKLIPWARALSEARTGEIDGVFAAFRTTEREAYLQFPHEPLMVQEMVFFVRSGSKIHFEGDLAKLSDLRIGTVNKVSLGKKFDQAAQGGALKHVELANSADNAFKMLLGDRTDLVILHRLEGLGAVKKLKVEKNIRILSPPVERTPAYIAFTKMHDEAAIMAKFDKALRELRDDGTYQRIERAYFM